jgi:hypothetical protein
MAATLKKLGNQGPKAMGDLEEMTLPDGTKAFGAKMGYISASGYDVESYVLDADKDGNRIQIVVFTVPAFAEYDEALFKEIAGTLTFK